MDFGSLLHVAQKNEQKVKNEIKYYSTKFEPPKKEVRSKQLSENIKKFLARKEAEEKQKASEARARREELLALRSQDRKAQRRVQVMLKRTKSANKSVISDAVDNDNTAVTLAGPSQPDEDDYGYVSQEASAFYNKMMQKYNTMPEEEKFTKSKKNTNTNLNEIKDRVRAALLKEQEDAMGPHRRKRKHKESDTEVIKEEERKQEPEKREKPKPKPAPPVLNFNDLLKIAEKKQFEPIKIEPKIVEEERLMTKKQKREFEKEKAWRDRKERGLTDNKEIITASSKISDKHVPQLNKIPKVSNQDNRINKIPKISTPPRNLKTSNSSVERNLEQTNSLQNKINNKSYDRQIDKNAYRNVSEKPTNKINNKHLPKPYENKIIKKSDNMQISANRSDQSLKTKTEFDKNRNLTKVNITSTSSGSASSAYNSILGRALSNSKSMNSNNIDKNKPLPKKIPIGNKELKRSEILEGPKRFPPSDMKPKQFPPADLKPKNFPPSDVRSKLPPKVIKKPQIGPRRRILDDDSEYDSEMDDFIDDGPDEEEDYSKHISEIFKYDRSRYRNEDYDVDNMESSFHQVLKEEFVSSKLGLMEDLEDMKQEAEEKKRKALMKKKLMRK